MDELDWTTMWWSRGRVVVLGRHRDDVVEQERRRTRAEVVGRHVVVEQGHDHATL